MRKCIQDTFHKKSNVYKDTTRNKNDLLLFVFRTTKGYRFPLGGLCATVLITGFTSAFFSMMIGLLVDAVLYEHNFRLFFSYFGIYAGLYLFNQGCHGGLNYLWAKLKITYLVNIRRNAYHHLMRIRAIEWNDLGSGDILKRLDGDVECILELIHRSFFYILENGIYIIVTYLYLMSKSPLLGGVALFLAPAVAWGNLYITKMLKKRNRKLIDEIGKLGSWQLEMLNGMEEIKLLGAGEHICGEYHARTQTILNQQISISLWEFVADRANILLLLAGRLVIYGCSAWLVASGKISVGDFVACAAYYESCVACLKSINGKMKNTAGNLAGVERVKEIFDLKQEESEGSILGLDACGIIVQDLYFSYTQSDSEKETGNSVLENVAFRVCPGERIALVGKSGDGKSTMLQLLFRLYDANNGEIFLGEQEIKTYERRSLRSKMGIVLQHPVLFRETIRYNICLQNDASQDELLWELLEDLKLRERIETLPKGLDTILGLDFKEDGLSGGERQRLAIARALWKKPIIFLLDEATSALDAVTEAEVNRAVWKWAGEACIVYAAHRFATIMQADRIIVLKEGQVADIGKHEELLERCEAYRLLYAAIA